MIEVLVLITEQLYGSDGGVCRQLHILLACLFFNPDSLVAVEGHRLNFQPFFVEPSHRVRYCGASASSHHPKARGKPKTCGAMSLSLNGCVFLFLVINLQLVQDVNLPLAEDIWDNSNSPLPRDRVQEKR